MASTIIAVTDGHRPDTLCFMSSQQMDVADLTVVSASPLPLSWQPGSPDDGLDDRLEFAQVRGGVDDPTDDPLERIAVREARHPAGPNLLFSWGQWQALLGHEPNLVDLR
jgi:hypothetical protein